MTKFYFAEDGNFGDADNILLVDDATLDNHFWEGLDWSSDSDRLLFAKWFADNNHATDNSGSETSCSLCDTQLLI
jgi:hypothetical protein